MRHRGAAYARSVGTDRATAPHRRLMIAAPNDRDVAAIAVARHRAAGIWEAIAQVSTGTSPLAASGACGAAHAPLLSCVTMPSAQSTLDMKLSSEIRSLDDLLARVEDGRLALPEFQRRFLWPPTAVVDLLVSVARQWPTGTFLFLDGPQDFAAKALQGAPPLTSADELILDGQQRMTSLYQALGDRADEVYFVDFAVLNGDNAYLEDAIRFGRRSVFARSYPTIESLAEARVAPISVIHNDRRFFEWAQFLPPAERADLIDVRARVLPGLKSYDIPVIRLEREVPLAALAKIFETLNRTGVRLSSFDLMVARLYPHEFHLAEKWRQALEETHTIIAEFDIAGIELLKLIALHHLVFRAGTGARVLGVRESDVLALPPRAVIEMWDWSLDAYSAALSFARQECGAITSFLLPASAQLLPLALILGVSGGNPPDELASWYWQRSFTQSYAQGANTQAVADARALAERARTGDTTEITRFYGVEREPPARFASAQCDSFASDLGFDRSARSARSHPSRP